MDQKVKSENIPFNKQNKYTEVVDGMSKEARYQLHCQIEAITPEEMVQIGERLRQVIQAGMSAISSSVAHPFHFGADPDDPTYRLK